MSSRSNRVLAWLGVVLSVLYLLNFDMGIVELIPDNFPVIGNLDEVGATLLLIRCINILRDKPKALKP